LPLQLGAHEPHTANSGGKHVCPPVHVAGQVPLHPSEPPHLPAHVGVHSPPSLSVAVGLPPDDVAPAGLVKPLSPGVVEEHA
jgi:hypothetical protein